MLDVHDSVPETFATKFSGGSVFWKALCLEERLSALVAHKVICVNHPQRDALVARGIPASKTFVSMNVPDPQIFKPSAVNGRPNAAADTFNLVYHGTMAERLGVDLIIRAVAQLHERVPGVRLHLWGDGDDLAGFQRLAKELGVEDASRSAPRAIRCEELPPRLSVDGCGSRRQPAKRGLRPDAAGQACRVRLPRHTGGRPAAEDHRALLLRRHGQLTTNRRMSQSLADAIYRLYCDPDAPSRRRPQRASQFLGEYGWERQGAEFVNLYQQLVEN